MSATLGSPTSTCGQGAGQQENHVSMAGNQPLHWPSRRAFRRAGQPPATWSERMPLHRPTGVPARPPLAPSKQPRNPSSPPAAAAHLLESALKCGILLNVLPILVERGGADQPQLQAGGRAQGGWGRGRGSSSRGWVTVWGPPLEAGEAGTQTKTAQPASQVQPHRQLVAEQRTPPHASWG